MSAHNPIGFFGKLPAYGDFIYRDLPSHFMSAWDAWLQGFVGTTKEQLGEAWLDIYLTSPIWRFAFGEGVIDQSTWVGIVLPSVDRVGRYFPFSIATALPGGINPCELITQREWFEAIEGHALKALSGELMIDDLVEAINAHRMIQPLTYTPAQSKANAVGSVIKMDFEEQSPQSLYSYLLDASLKESLASYSVWSTQGSNYVEPCLFYSRGLPALRGLAAMLDGDWEARGWNEPYRLNQQ